MPKNNKSQRKSMNNEKLRKKIEKLILKYSKKNKKEEKVLKLSKATEKELKNLLKRIPKENEKANPELTQELTAIHKNFKNEMKSIKEESKKERKERKLKKSENRKLKKEKKVEKELKLEKSRISELPELKENDLSEFVIIVDGWNITGCDKIARKSMRNGRGKGAKRMIYLLSKFGLESNFMKTNGKNNVKLVIHFDGNGKSEMKEFENSLNISVLYSGKNEIVDDRLVRELSLNIKDKLLLNGELALKVLNNPNRKYLVVTSDRELTLRLNEIGVNCMKSGCFYKKYLKEFVFCGLEESEINNPKNKEKKEFKKEKKNPKKSKKHWKKYIKNRFSDNSTSSDSSESSSESSINSSDIE